MEYRIELIPVIVGLVEFLKKFGLQGKWSALAGIVIAVALELSVTFFPAEAVVGLRALILGLVSIGLYDIAKRAGRGLVSRLNGS